MRDVFGFEGKSVVVVGAASGMGAAATALLVDLGAEVHALDVQPVDAPVKRALEVDLRDPEAIAAGLRELPGRVDALLQCAGLPGPPFSALDTMLVNFVGPREITRGLVDRIPTGGAIASITSVAGMGYRKNLENVEALLDTPDYASGRSWCEAHPEAANGYLFSKQAIILDTKRRAAELAPRGVRVNCISPAPTDTPMLQHFHAQVSKDFIEEHFLAPVGRNATPEEMAEPLVFLCSDAARFVSGQNLFVDFAYEASVEVGAKQGLL